MSFTSLGFPVFMLAMLSVHLFPARWRWAPLLAGSYLFYAFHNVVLTGLLAGMTLLSYACALLIEHTQTRRARRLLLLLGAVVCLGILGVFKYLDLAAQGVRFLLGMKEPFSGFGLLLPMGISFYVFQTLSYIIDVYRGTVRAERHLGYYALFVAFFPQLVAGPIERPGALLPQLRAIHVPDQAETAEALRCLVRGYARKVMAADVLARFVDAAYADPMRAGGAAIVAATALFAVQIYCDFAGYTDIARGCAHLLGVRLSENFRSPYAALTVRDFWRRWHISLTRWFTDYVYIPLGGSRRGRARTCANILIVFLLSGLWHGADVTFILWGALHGAYLVIELVLEKPLARLPKLLRRTLTLAAVGFAWVFFRADGMGNALAAMQAIFLRPEWGSVLAGMDLAPAMLPLVILLCLAAFRLEKLPLLTPGARQSAGICLVYFMLIVTVVCCRCLAVASGGAAAFIYFQF